MNTKSKKAFVTGVFGQDGSYLAEYLLSKGYVVMGTDALDSLPPSDCTISEDTNFAAILGDFTDPSAYEEELKKFKPDEVFNFAAISDLKTACANRERTIAVNFNAFKQLVQTAVASNQNVRIFQALSSRILTPDTAGMIRESSPLVSSENPYDIAKRRSYEKVVVPLREKGVFISSGFLCNHESPRRDERFVSGKIARAVAAIERGDVTELHIGNPDAKRDWSFAGDVVCAAHTILQRERSGDYVIGSGELHSVRDFVNTAFAVIDKPLVWEGRGEQARAYDQQGKLRVRVASEFYQPDNSSVVADIRKITSETDWKAKVSFEELVKMMVETHRK